MLDATKRRRVKKKTPKKGMSLKDQISRMFSTERNKKRRGISTPMDVGEFSFSPTRRNKATGDLSVRPGGERGTFKTIFEQKRMADAAKRRLQSAKAKKQMISKGSSPQGRGFPKKSTFISSAALAKAFKESEAKRPAQSKAKNFNVGVSKGGVSFKEAFKHFKNKGQKVFTWNGKKYTTELAKSSKKVKVASPQSRPSTPKKEVVKRKVVTTESPKGGMMKKKKFYGKKKPKTSAKPKASPKQGRFGKVPPKMSLSYAEKNYAPFKNKLKSGHVIRTINGKRFQVPIADAKKTR